MGLPTLVLLPGSLCDARIFAAQRQGLRGLVNTVPVDYRGLRPGSDWVDGLLGKLPERFSVAGFSLGGLWALEMLRRAPHRIERLALIASNAQAASPATRRRSHALWRLWTSRGPASVARHLKPGYFHHTAQRGRHAQIVRDMAMATGHRAAAAAFSWAATRPDSHRLLAGYQGPLLVVSGDKDRLCPPAWQQAMLRAQPAARWVPLPRVGHFVPLEAPAALRDALRDWLSC